MPFAQECTPVCRCQYVQRWLDVHEKYFTDAAAKPIVPLTPQIVRLPSSSQANYFYNSPMQVPSKVQQPAVLQAPYRISPMKPVYD